MKNTAFLVAGLITGGLIAICAALLTEPINNKNFADICAERGGRLEVDHGVPFCAKVVK